jgi:hypothetical protein
VSRRLSLPILVASLLGIGVAYASAFLPGGAPAWAPALLLAGSVTALVAISLLGAASGARGADPRLLAPLAVAGLLLAGGVGAGFLLPEPGPGAALYGGLPAGAAFLLFGAGLLPLLVVPLAYAWTFPRTGFGEGELERVRDRAIRAREEAEGAPERPGERGAAAALAEDGR